LKSLLMQKRGYKNGNIISGISILLVSDTFFYDRLQFSVEKKR
jgi:hypothetical protein